MYDMSLAYVIMADVLLKVGRKSTIFLFLVVIFATFILIKEDKHFRFQSTDVAELHVGKLMSQDCSQISARPRTKRLSCKFKFNCSPQLVRFTRDVLAVNLLLLCEDVLQNPGPVTVKCFKCSKTIRRNQGRATCVGCTQPYHLKCLGADFDYSAKCGFCSVAVMNATEEEDLTETTLDFVGDLSEATNQRGLKFLHQNIRSLRGKLAELNILVSQCPNLHIMAFTETWLNNNIADGEVSLLGYSIHRGDRADGPGGGIAVYVKDNLSVIRRSDLEIDFSGECMWLEILLPKAKGFLFGTFYLPRSQSDFLDSFQEVLDCASADNKEMLITGDFNFDLLDTSRPKSIRDLKGIFSSFNLAQLIDKATRITKDSATLLDLFATNFPRNITLAKVT